MSNLNMNYDCSNKKQNKQIRILRLLSRIIVGCPSRHVIHLSKGLSEYGIEAKLEVRIPAKYRKIISNKYSIQNLVKRVSAEYPILLKKRGAL